MMDAVLFDLDGTLIDTTSAVLASIQHTLKHFTGESREPDAFRKYLGMTLDDALHDIVPQDVDAARDMYVQHNLSIHRELVKAFPGAADTLKHLKDMGVKLAIVTSKRRTSAEFGLQITGLAGLFDAAVFFGDTEKSKPDAQPILRALELLGVSSGRVLMVGDSVYDIGAAKNADSVLENVEVKSVGAAYGPAGQDALLREHPDFLIDRLEELIRICERAD